MSVAFRPNPKDWYISDKIMDDFIKDMMDVITVDRKYDIPYLAGYSKNGKKFYIDYEMPEGFTSTKGKYYKTDKYLMVHEFVEKTLEDAFKKLGLDVPYQFCHQVALRIERDAVENDKIEWKEYNNFMMKWVKIIGDRKEYPNTPKDLDLKPYHDEDDKSTLDKMRTEAYHTDMVFPIL